MLKKPVLAITLGDPSGIGPEIVMKCLLEREIHRVCRPLIVGYPETLSFWKKYFPLNFRPVTRLDQARFLPQTADCYALVSALPLKFKPGYPDSATGQSSAHAVEKSVELALKGLAQGVVNAPISKTAWKLGGFNFPGHTEMIGELCGVKSPSMAILSGPLKTVMVTRHVPLSQISSRLKKKDIVTSIDHALAWLMREGIARPKIGVCSLNPHAGENGLLGKEEIRIIGPAVRLARKRFRAELSGPLPADSAFRDHKSGIYDCLITMYHDQSMIPLKLFDPHKLVNCTLGLPFPRTSPGHGTAFEIAGKNKVDHRPMLEAIKTCAQLCSC